MKLTQKIKDFFPSITVYIYYLLSSITFCYMYFHKQFYSATFHEENMGGIYWILSFDAIKPNQFRLLVPFIFKLFRTVFVFISDRPAFFAIILTFTFLIIIVFYNILNVYFKDKNINRWLALLILYPMVWHFIILNEEFEFTDFANLLFILAGYYFIIKKQNKLLLLTFFLGTFNHDSIGFIIVMYIMFNIKNIFKMRTIVIVVVMVLNFILVKKMMEQIFISNKGLSFRFNYIYNLNSLVDIPIHRVIRNFIFYFGGMHLFVLYFFISGKWKKFRTDYLYISLTIVPYVLILFLIHTILEARNYITAIPFAIMLFLLYFTGEPGSFLKPADKILSNKSPDIL
jgi:hypothetical protein